MINIPQNNLKNQENENSLLESFFDDKANKEWLSDIEKKNIEAHKQQNKKAEQLKDLLVTEDTMEKLPSITRIPPPSNYYLQRKNMKIKEIPDLDEDSQIDCSSCDVSNLDIEKYKSILPHVSFDTQTKRPKEINEYFDPKEILEIGKNPGLNIKKLHNEGITGKGVKIAIVDQTLLVNHQEYKNQLKMYDEIGEVNEDASMHWPAVSSLAVGKNCGIAPEANLYYIAVKSGEEQEDKTFIFNLKGYAKWIDKIVETNELLPENDKIRVISISLGLVERIDRDPEKKAYKSVEEAIQRAEKSWIYVVHTGDKHLTGAWRNPKEDPDDFWSYTKGWWRKKLEKWKYKNCILFPMDSRTVASPIGDKEYSFYPDWWFSWVVPYVAWIYALCCQVKPDINKDIFWEAVYETSTKISLDNEDFRIINPTALIEKIRLMIEY